MVDFVLTLGGVAFQDFEVPDSIRAGGGQMLFTHKYPGGPRTVDTMGPDDDTIPWSGWFEGPNAQARCQQLDVMRRQGLQVILDWSAYSYLVVIKQFKWDFRRYYHIGYSILLEVVQDQNNPQPAGQDDIDQQITSDASDGNADALALAAGTAPP